MEVVHARCAGLDVHKKTVVACVRIQDGQGIRHDVRTFDTTTTSALARNDPGLLARMGPGLNWQA